MNETCGRCQKPMIRAKYTPLEPGQVRHHSHGRCRSCRSAIRSEERCAGGSRTTWLNADLMAEWDFLRRQGVHMRDAAPRLGVTYAALDKAICRARSNGDPRAIRRAA